MTEVTHELSSSTGGNASCGGGSVDAVVHPLVATEADGQRHADATSAAREARKAARERERQERLKGKLTNLTFADLTCVRHGRAEFVKRGLLHCVVGSKSQFDARGGRLREVMPPATCDCCQTFATLSAVLLSSLGFAVMLTECCHTSTINYLLYISAWMHQLTVTSWPQHGVRPTVGDLNTCLHLRQFFPSKVHEDEFHVVFYNQAGRAMELLQQMCNPAKRSRDEDGRFPVCGYVIVSGDYTVSIFAVEHDIRKGTANRYAQAWSFYICDSHGTQPWSHGKASITGLTFGTPSQVVQVDDGASQEGNEPKPSHAGGDADGQSRSDTTLVTVKDGLHYFSLVLFALLEEHRRGATPLTGGSTPTVPYMTWTPLRRRRSLAYTAEELKAILDEQWIPKVLTDPVVQKEVQRFRFTPLECFWNLQTPAK